MNKKILLKSMALILVCLTLLTPLCACKKDNNEDASGTVSTDDGTGVLSGVRFNGEVLNVLSWIPSNVKEYVEVNEATLDAIDQSIYLRNLQTLDRLNLKMNWKEIAGNAAAPEYINEATIANQSGGEYDMYVCYSNFASSLMMNGVLRNLLEYEYLDFSHPWWPQEMLNDCTIADKLYFCTGDISTNLVFMTSAVFFNKTLASEYKVDELVKQSYGSDGLYDLVKDGKWTYEALMTLSANTYADKDQDGKKSLGDIYGFGTYGTLIDNFYYGADQKTVVAKDGGFALSSDFTNTDRVTNILTEVGRFLLYSGDAMFYEGFEPARDSFAASLNLFSLAPASHAYVTHFKTDGLKYGVLPVPKYEAEQDKYYSVHSFPYSMYGISSATDKAEMTSAYIQVLGEESYNTSRVTIIENTLQLRYADDMSDSEMWQIVIDSQCFDLGRIFSRQLGKNENEALTVNLFRTHLSEGDIGWGSALAANQKSLEGYIATLSASIKDLQT